MKYIRMKNGTIKTQYDTIRPQFVVKRADTIEELCDEFVLYYMDLNEQSDKDTFYPYAQYERCGNVWQKDKKNIIEKTIKGHHTLYGAIWTDKGLIYVAKMNDKGELELL